jgi:quercetin dioxygenase-like cupin family protein
LIQKASSFHWADIQSFKDQPGSWAGLSRQVLSLGNTAFEARYFEIAPGGFTTYERHHHEHFILVLRGSGRVRIREEWTDVEPMDAIRIASFEPHQFENASSEPFGFLDTVDRNRDNPQLLDSEGRPKTSE